MSIGPPAQLGGGLSIGPSLACICAKSQPWLPPPPCCTDGGGGGGNGGSCSSNGNGNGNGNGTLDGIIVGCWLNETYGGGIHSGPTLSIDIRNGATLQFLGSGGNVPCTPLSGTPPVAVLASGTHSIQVRISYQTSDVVEGMWLTCEETDVTLTSECSAVTFYFNDGADKHFSTPGGPGTLCSTQTAGTGSSGANSGTGTVIVEVQFVE